MMGGGRGGALRQITYLNVQMSMLAMKRTIKTAQTHQLIQISLRV